MPAKTFTLLEKKLALYHQHRNPSEDALWLAESFIPQENDTILDAGCGCGVIGLALLTLHPKLNLKIKGIDISEAEITQATKNIALNNLQNSYTAQQLPFEHLKLLKTTYNHVVANLPFHAQTRGHNTPNASKGMAHTLPAGTLNTWLEHLLTTLKLQGQLHILIHAQEAEQTIDFIEKNNLNQTHNYIVTKKNNPPKRVIFHIQKS